MVYEAEGNEEEGEGAGRGRGRKSDDAPQPDKQISKLEIHDASPIVATAATHQPRPNKYKASTCGRRYYLCTVRPWGGDAGIYIHLPIQIQKSQQSDTQNPELLTVVRRHRH